MERTVIAKKKRILSRMTPKQYRELLSFVEEFYLADYSLKILVARKGSNLFCALIDLLREEDGGRVRHLYEEKFSGREKPIIISDRALEYYAQDIKDGKYPKILIADDTIRHGKTIFGLCDEVSKLLASYKGQDERAVDVRVFASCKDDMIKNPYIKEDSVKHYVGLDEYRVISDRVIDILYLAGQPYISYIPNIVVQKESPLFQLVKESLKDLPVCLPDGEWQKRLNFQSNIWIDPQKPTFAMFQSMRFYTNDDLNQYTIVPMVSLMPISDESLIQYGKILKDLLLKDYYDKVFFACKELSYRTVIYVVSALFLRLYFRQKLGYKGKLYDLEKASEEKMNFGGPILNQQKLNQMNVGEIKVILGKMEEAYQSVELSEIRQLDGNIEELDNEVNNSLQITLQQKAEIASLVQRFFSISGDWSIKKGCQCCYPVICLSNRIKAEGGDEREGHSQILKEIDYGSGSIIDKAKEKNGKMYYLSFLNAGERNYKYKEKRYFPFLYGLLEIEQRAKEKNVDPEQYKMSFDSQYEELNQLDDYDKQQLKEFCKANIISQYKSVLIKDAWLYVDKNKLNQAIVLADKIMQ